MARLPAISIGVHIQIVLSAANCETQSITGVIAVVHAETEDELTQAADELIKRTWDDWRRSSGISGLRWLWQKRSLTEFAELILLGEDAMQTTPVPDVDPTILRNARTAILRFVMPPWGLTGDPVPVRGLHPPSSSGLEA